MKYIVCYNKVLVPHYGVFNSPEHMEKYLGMPVARWEPKKGKRGGDSTKYHWTGTPEGEWGYGAYPLAEIPEDATIETLPPYWGDKPRILRGGWA